MSVLKKHLAYWKRALVHTYAKTSVSSRLFTAGLLVTNAVLAVVFAEKPWAEAYSVPRLGLAALFILVILVFLIRLFFISPAQIHADDSEKTNTQLAGISPLKIESWNSSFQLINRVRCHFVIHNSHLKDAAKHVTAKILEFEGCENENGPIFPVILTPEKENDFSINAGDRARWVFFFVMMATTYEPGHSYEVCYPTTAMDVDGRLPFYPPIVVGKEYRAKVQLTADGFFPLVKDCSLKIERDGILFRFTLKMILK